MTEKRGRVPFWAGYLFLILPFLAGGFHTYVAVLTSAILLSCLIKEYRAKGQLKVVLNAGSVMCFFLVLGYCITPFWAADKGMAVFGILRYLPVLLLSLLLMQSSQAQKIQCFRLLPVCGAVMTILGCIFWAFPATGDYVTVNGRLSGFLQYPNTFAVFLLVGIAIQGTKENHRKTDWLTDVVLITGIVLSGSRTGVLLLVFTLLVISPFHKKIRPMVGLAAVAGVGVLGAALIKSGSRITLMGRDIGSLFVRVLYYKDALPVILKHPFGLGYMGYRALETTFQTSRYTVSFVHSGLLQLLLDIGWIPSILFLAVLCKTVLSTKTTPMKRTVLLVLTAHSLVDFDLQFFLFWSILLLCLDFETGKEYCLKMQKTAGLAVSTLILVLCAWLGFGDLLYRTGNNDGALKMTPFHTDALASAMQETADPTELDDLADRILLLNPTHALAYSAKANAAYSRGQVMEMIQYKETALTLTPYTIAEYCDYIEKLYTVLEWYIQTQDTESAVYCLKKLLAVPEMMEEVAAKTDPLAYKTGNNSELVLPEQYRNLINELAKANPDY